MAHTIIRRQEGDWNGLDYNDQGYFPKEECLPIGRAKNRGEAIKLAREYAALCDQQAENENLHDFCGSHEFLRNLLSKHCPPFGVLAIMRTIAKAGGLQEHLSQE